jgi:hypothetical protein
VVGASGVCELHGWVWTWAWLTSISYSTSGSFTSADTTSNQALGVFRFTRFDTAIVYFL